MDKMREEFDAWIKPLGHFWLVNEAVYWEVWKAANKSAVPDGYCVVPVDPTDEMMEAADDWSIGSDGVTIGWFTSSEIYKEMIKKAPKP